MTSDAQGELACTFHFHSIGGSQASQIRLVIVPLKCETVSPIQNQDLGFYAGTLVPYQSRLKTTRRFLAFSRSSEVRMIEK